MTGLPADGGSGEAAVTQQAPNPPQLTLEDHGDHLVPVKIDGKTETMRLRDALQGVAHQRKVTQVSQQMRQYENFFNELERNPSLVIGQLQEQFGVDSQEPVSTQEQEIPMTETAEPATPGVDVAALTAQIEQLTSRLAEQEQRQAHETQTAKVERELEELKAQFGDAYDREAVLAFAVDNQLPDVKLAFHAWRSIQSNASQPAEQAPTAVQNAQVLGAIAPGAPTVTPEVAPANTGTPKSAMDAIRRAAESLGDDGAAWLAAMPQSA